MLAARIKQLSPFGVLVFPLSKLQTFRVSDATHWTLSVCTHN